MAFKTTIDVLGEDLLHNIVARLPALPFASAACVSRSWNYVCGRVLSRPKLSSACSFKPSLQAAFEEVANKVLSEPIRPQFAIACINSHFSLQEANQLMTAKLSSNVPFIIKSSDGIIGRDAFSGEFKQSLPQDLEDKGIMLTLGYAPGVKVKSFSLIREPQNFVIDKFIADIKEFSTSISGSQSPAAIMIFGELEGGKNVMEKLDNAMPPETVIVGSCHCGFRYEASAAGVALVFVMDKNKPLGTGETGFHAVLSSGLSPFGPTFKVNSVGEFRDERVDLSGLNLTAVIEEPLETFDIDACRFEYIGVTKRRICEIGQKEAKWMTSISFHDIVEYDEASESLCVVDVGIERGDTYQYYYEDSSTSRSRVENVSNFLRSLKKSSINGSDKWEVCGGLIFTSFLRDASFLGERNADSDAFLESFPGVTLAGTTCEEEIGRGYLPSQESQEQKSARACLHICSAVYLIISYTP